jgi:tetratricopeptide (TPR) repeat protein
MAEQNKDQDNSELLLELVDKGIALQRSEKHQEAIVCFDEAISIDKNMGGEADSNLLLLKDNSLKKLGKSDKAKQDSDKAE